MRSILITGAKGFIGRHLVARLRHLGKDQLFEYDVDNSPEELRHWAESADVIVHLAGVNRPTNVDEFQIGNTELTRSICNVLREAKRTPHFILSSSIQAQLDNPYGVSKRDAEGVVSQFANESGAKASIFRLKNVFGPRCRPNYNSVTATFCHNIANELPISISNPANEVSLVHVDDVITAFIREMDSPSSGTDHFVNSDVIPSYTITLGDLAGRIQFYHEMQESLKIPDFSVRFNQQLYATYLSYVNPAKWEYGLNAKHDNRGSLAEFVKSPHFGQIFVSRTHPGITRGNHYHAVKTEKFFVVEGEGLIRFRSVEGSEILEYRVRGEDYRVLEIPPGFTHSITNVGQGEMITLFWASEIFDPDRPDTYFLPVDIDR